MFFRKKKQSVFETDPKTADWETLHHQQLLLSQRLIQVNTEMMERYIKIVMSSEHVESAQADRELLKQSTERLLRLNLALNNESEADFRARMSHWYEPASS